MAAVTYSIGAAPDIYFSLKFEGRNSKGPRLNWEFPNCKLDQKGTIELIGDKYQTWPFDCRILSVNTTDTSGNIVTAFGTITHPDDTLVSPITKAYSMGIGLLSIWRLDLDSGFRLAGAASKVSCKFDFKTEQHKQYMNGAASIDDETTTEMAMTFEAMLDETTALNIRDVLYALVAA